MGTGSNVGEQKRIDRLNIVELSGRAQGPRLLVESLKHPGRTRRCIERLPLAPSPKPAVCPQHACGGWASCHGPSQPCTGALKAQVNRAVEVMVGSCHCTTQAGRTTRVKRRVLPRTSPQFPALVRPPRKVQSGGVCFGGLFKTEAPKAGSYVGPCFGEARQPLGCKFGPA